MYVVGDYFNQYVAIIVYLNLDDILSRYIFIIRV